ncbi:MAG: ABC transporter substrate-binding protein, partial [Dehalococcoidia bacterium]|nr:ABC transporter substrate-binding protein [Dehalococcoidia bacterium]
ILTLAHRGDPIATWDSMRSAFYELLLPAGAIWGDSNLVKPCRADVSQLCPGLSQRWQSNADFTQWTFKVRDNVLWHDGTPFTAKDVKFWIDMAYLGAKSGDKVRGPAIYKATFGDVQRVEVLDGNQVRVTLGRPSTIYPMLLAMDYNPIIQTPEHLMGPLIDKGQVDVSPKDVGWVGTGPFKMDKYEQGSVIQVRRFEKYWEKDDKGGLLPYLDGVDYVIFKDPGAMDAAFRTGRLDGGTRGLGYYMTPERKAAYETALGNKVWFGEVIAGHQYVAFNTLRSGPFQDERVRRAVSLWLDKRQAIQAVSGGFGVLHTMISPKSPWPSHGWDTWPGYNLATRESDKAQAKRLLTDAGYPNGLKAIAACVRPWAVRCEFLQGSLAPLGIDAEIFLYDVANEFTVNQQGNYDMKIGSTTASLPEATEGHLTRRSLSPVSTTVHEDARVPEFYRRLGSTEKTEERIAIWRELEQYFIRDRVYVVPMSGDLGVVPYRSHVKGLAMPAETPPRNSDMATVWLDK